MSATWTAAGDPPPECVGFMLYNGLAPLGEGKVLLAGGTKKDFSSSDGSAIFDVASGAWTATAPLTEPRRVHTLTAFGEGLVLAAGGVDAPMQRANPPLDTAELFAAETGWVPTTPMLEARAEHGAVLLHDGRVLVAGGVVPRTPVTNHELSSAEIFEPGSKTWLPAASMIDARGDVQLVVLPDGRVLVAGGSVTIGDGPTAQLAFCEVYDPVADTWTPTGSLRVPRSLHQLVLLGDGTVLAIGGINVGTPMGPLFDGHSLRTVERYDPATGQWSDAEPMPWGRAFHIAVALDTGEALAIGGCDYAVLDAGFRNAALFDPVTGRWTPTGGMVTGRYGLGAAPLPGGRALAVGGVIKVGPSFVEDNVMATGSEVFTR